MASRLEGTRYREVRDFVQSVLGCNCPPEVLELIEAEICTKALDNTPLLSRLNVGNRLLVFVVLDDDIDPIRLLSVLGAGMDERERKGFNRFRLAVAAANVEGTREILRQIIPQADGMGSSLDGIAGLDDKVHLHVVSDVINFIKEAKG